MRFLVFQHIAIEHPGIFRDFFAADGIAWDAVELDAGEAIPSFDGYDALWVMGGPMDVWETDRHPWLVARCRPSAKPSPGDSCPIWASASGISCSAQRSAARSARRRRPKSASSRSS